MVLFYRLCPVPDFVLHTQDIPSYSVFVTLCINVNFRTVHFMSPSILKKYQAIEITWSSYILSSACNKLNDMKSIYKGYRHKALLVDTSHLDQLGKTTNVGGVLGSCYFLYL